MLDFEDFINYLTEANKKLVDDVKDAWCELKEDVNEMGTAKYLRPGGIACCKADGKKYYGILTGTQIISLNADGEPEHLELGDFLDIHDAYALKVAGKKRIAVGKHEVDFAARMELDGKRYPSTKAFVLHCLGASGVNVDTAIEQAFGSFEWLDYTLPEPDDEAEDKNEESTEE